VSEPSKPLTSTEYGERLASEPRWFRHYLGIEILEAFPERTVLTMAFRPELARPSGGFHGGALASLADAAAGTAMASGLQAGEQFSTIELKMNLIRSVNQGTITATAVPIHRGRRTSVYEVRITDPADKLVAIFTCTQLMH
jgi:1,4-dihydroxy-2-naphthoyl-CoA hydrolase